MKKWIASFALLVLLFAGCKKETSSDVPKTTPNASQNDSVAVKSTVDADNQDDGINHSLFKTKARSVIGDVNMLKGGSGDKWKQVRIGQWVVENDRIQTKIESETRLGASDGSVFVVSENSDVALEAFEDSTGMKLYLVSVDKGKVYFDIQKQKNASFQFKTGTVGAAIRGTAGFVGNVKGNTVVSLKEGVVDVSGKTGKVNRIAQKQTILVDFKGKASKLDLKSSGTKQLAEAIDSLTKGSEDEVAKMDLQKALKEFDKNYAEQLKKFEQGLSFQARKIQDTITQPLITLQAFVDSGVVVSVWGESDTVSADGVYKRNFAWDSTAYGTKRFLVSCGDGIVEFPCYMWVVEYVSATDYVAADSVQTKADKASSLITKLTVDLGGTERVHLPPPTGRANRKLNISLKGITKEDLEDLSSIIVKRGGKVVRTYNENQLTSLNYSVPVIIGPYETVRRGIIAKNVEFEVVVKTKSGKEFTGHKTFQAFCQRGNHDSETNEQITKNDNAEFDAASSFFENE